jgi:hypothetical protein
MDVGTNVNPVLILTARELFRQFHLGEFSQLYGTDSQLARGIFMRDEIREICEFTQRLYLGMPSNHEVRQAKASRRTLKHKRFRAGAFLLLLWNSVCLFGQAVLVRGTGKL